MSGFALVIDCYDFNCFLFQALSGNSATVEITISSPSSSSDSGAGAVIGAIAAVAVILLIVLIILIVLAIM